MTTTEEVNIQTTDVATLKGTNTSENEIKKEFKNANQKVNIGSKKNFTLKTPKVINDKPFIGYIYITNNIKY